MSDIVNMKEVKFGEYCPKCKFYDKNEDEDPCFDCLQDPARLYSHIPTRYDGPRPTTKKDWVREANEPKG